MVLEADKRGCYTLYLGVWRSLVAHLHGVQGVEGSNPFTPTKLKTLKTRPRGGFFIEAPQVEAILTGAAGAPASQAESTVAAITSAPPANSFDPNASPASHQPLSAANTSSDR